MGKIVVLSAVLAAALLTTGCARAGIYLRNRAEDLGDCYMVEALTGPGLEVHGYITEYVGTAVGYADTEGLGWHPRQILNIERKSEGILFLGGMGVEGRDTHYKVVEHDSIIWFVFCHFSPRMPFGYPRERIPRWPHNIDVQGGFTAGIIGLHVGFSPAQLADFLTGWFGADLLKDDYPAAGAGAASAVETDGTAGS